MNDVNEPIDAGTAAPEVMPAPAAEPAPAGKVFRIGVISTSIEGKPQRTNGHGRYRLGSRGILVKR